MRLYFGGAESPTLRKRLLDAGATRLSLNYAHLYPRGPSLILDEVLPPDVGVVVDSGASWANENATLHDHDGWQEYAQAYLRFVVDNVDRVACFTEFDFLAWGYDAVTEGREHFWSRVPDGRWMPVWHDWEELVELSEIYPVVALPDVPDSETERRRILGYTHRFGTKFHGLGTSRPQDARLLHSMSSTAWTAVHRFGETPVWEGNKLTRYRADKKDEVRKSKAHVFERAGLDPQAIAAEDPVELTKLAVWAWSSWAEHVDQGADVESEGEGAPQPTSTSVDVAPEPSPSPPVPVRDVDPKGPRWKGELPPGTTLLPVMGLSREVDGSVEVTSVHRTLRRCDSCALAGMCPAFKPGNDCAYAIPVEIRSKDQLLGVMRSILEMQTQRVMFLRFAEELEGGHSKELSTEMDRLLSLTEKVKTVQDDSAYLKMTVETRSGAGVLSRLFGSTAGELANPVDPDRAEDVIAEVLED